MSVNGTLVEDKIRIFKGECAHFSFNKCPIYIHDGASAKFSTNSHVTDNSVVAEFMLHKYKRTIKSKFSASNTLLNISEYAIIRKDHFSS